MASFSSKSNAIRSISLPSRSHPSTSETEAELSKLKTRESSSSSSTAPNAETVCNGLSGLVNVFTCMDELLNLPQTLQALSKHQNDKWVDGLLEVPVKLLDICGSTKDLVSQIKEIIRDLQSSFRRRKGDSSIEASIAKYTSFRKNMNKIAKKLLASLKQMDQETEGSVLDVNQHVAAVIRVVREANAMSISIFQAVLAFLTASKAKKSRWSSVSRLMHKGTVACEGQQQDNNSNELECLENALRSQSEPTRVGQMRLEKLEADLDCVETGLESMFRCLIKSRISLLNVVSC